MTPERAAYLAKISEREKTIRKNIGEYKAEIKCIKQALSNGYDCEFNLGALRWRKFHLMLFRHELARLKGMDRVVVPEVYHSTGVCHCPKCATAVWVSSNNYCPQCGRRLLWEKAKK